MPIDFDINILKQILTIKLLLPVFWVLGSILIWKKAKDYWFLSLYTVLSALAYYLFANDMQLMFWGLRGDELTLAAMYEKMSHLPWKDFAYSNLTAFYPPLFFALFGFLGSLLDFNGVQIAKLAAFVSLFSFPWLIYFIQKWYWKNKKEDLNLPHKLVFFLTPVIVSLFIDWDAFIQKPYELISAAFSVLWISFLILDIRRKSFGWKTFLIYGITGGIIFMTYYLWLVFGAIAISFYALSIPKKEQFIFYSRLLGVGILTLLVASPYLFPLIMAYQSNGSENWQTILLTSTGISLYAPMFSIFSFRALLMLGGFFSLLFFYKREYIKILFFIFLSSYVWQIVGFFNVILFDTPIQEFKGFYFLNRTVLAFALAYGIGELWGFLQNKKIFSKFKKPVLLMALLFLSTQMFFGFFIDNPKIQDRLVESKTLRDPIADLVKFLEEDGKIEQKTILHSGIVELNAFLPINNFIYFNQHNSHPAALFSGRLSFIKILSLSGGPEEFYNLSTENFYGSIDRFILFNQDEGLYNLAFEVDNFPNLSKGLVVEIKKDLIVEPFFEKIYENSEYVVWDRVEVK